MPKGIKGFQKGHPVYGGIETRFRKGHTTYFMKGHIPWNKGMKMTKEERIEKMKEYRRTHKEQIYLSQQRRRRERKVKLVKLNGGKCNHCGIKYNGKNAAVFSFHHLDRKKKNFIIGEHDMSRRWKSLVKEAQGCLLLCSNCHRLVHSRRY